MVTVQIGNMVNAGLSEEEYKNPEFLADFLIKTWENSGKGRKAGVAVAVSQTGLYHAHCALYSNSTTLKHVSEVMFSSHVEPQLSGKRKLRAYLLKEEPYSERGEVVLYTAGLENIQHIQGARSDTQEIEDMLKQGMNPVEIMESNFLFRKYERMIRSAYIDKKKKDTPLVKDMHCVWHCGESGTGKTYSYVKLCEEFSAEDVYLVTDYDGGGFDGYVDAGCAKIIFLDEFKGSLKFSTLLVLLDKYSRAEVHSRFHNTPCLWNEVHVASIYPPEEVYSFMVEEPRQNRDKITQLLRRLDLIVYHYKEDGEYKTYEMPASEYKNFRDLQNRALGVDTDSEQNIQVSDEDFFKLMKI